MKKLCLYPVVFLVIALSGAVGIAGPQWQGYQMGPGYDMSPCLTANLDLTAKQTARLQELRDAFLKDTKPLQNELSARRAEYRLLWADSTPDRHKIVTKQKEIIELQKQLQQMATQYRLACSGLLTSSQRAKLWAFTPGKAWTLGPEHPAR